MSRGAITTINATRDFSGRKARVWPQTIDPNLVIKLQHFDGKLTKGGAEAHQTRTSAQSGSWVTGSRRISGSLRLHLCETGLRRRGVEFSGSAWEFSPTALPFDINYGERIALRSGNTMNTAEALGDSELLNCRVSKFDHFSLLNEPFSTKNQLPGARRPLVNSVWHCASPPFSLFCVTAVFRLPKDSVTNPKK